MQTQKRVEALRSANGPEALLFEPFFQNRQTAVEVRRLQPLGEQRKWARFFELHGCLRCSRKDVRHASHGLCAKCRRWVYYELTKIVSEGLLGKPPETELAGTIREKLGKTESFRTSDTRLLQLGTAGKSGRQIAQKTRTNHTRREFA